MSGEKVIKYHVLNEDSYEYNLIVTKSGHETKFEIFHTDSAPWTLHTRGTLAFEMTDTGDGWNFPRKYKNLDYSDALYVRLILGLELYLDTNPANKTPWNLVEVDNVITL